MGYNDLYLVESEAMFHRRMSPPSSGLRLNQMRNKMKQSVSVTRLTFSVIHFFMYEKIQILNIEKYFEFGNGDLPAAVYVVRRMHIGFGWQSQKENSRIMPTFS